MKFGTRELLFLIVMLALLGSAWYFVFKKADERIATLNIDTSQKLEKLRELSDATNRIADMDRKIAEVREKIRFFESKLPRERDVEKIISQVTRQAKILQLKVGMMQSLRTEKSPAGYSEQQVKLVISGNFTGFYQFLLEVEKMARITRVNQLKLSKINEQDGSTTADLTLSVYFQPDSVLAK